MKQKIIKELSKLLADTYALYLKTQNYHWHVSGPNFKGLHELFEEQYISLADAVDELAERIVTLGGKAPATFREYVDLTSIKPGNSSANSETMIDELYNDHGQLINDMNKVIGAAQDISDEGTVALISERIAQHEKVRWMLGASK